MDALSDKKDGDGEKPIPQRKRATLTIKDENPETNGENLEIKDENEENLGKKRGRIKSQIVCEVCQKPMRSKHHLKVHSAVHTGEKNFVCQICKKGFQQKWNLVTHTARVHSKIKPFKCSECGKAFGYSSHFKRHVKTHFLEKIEAPDAVKKRILNPHKCEFCERCFDSNYKLDIHTKKHTGDKPFVCDKCGRAFTTRRLIAAHMARKHDMEVDFICEHCGKSFPDRSAMVLHFETGHKICDVIKESVKQKKIRKPPNKSKDKELIPCEVCGKTINRVSMNKHINIHYRNRVYKCKYCSKEFLESGQRRIHERKHTGEKPYICDVCGKGHTQYGNLMTHRKRYHNLTDRAPKLWKRTTDPEITAGLKSETEKSDPVPSEEKGENNNQENVEKSEKPPYTGDETIEEFMQKASVWIDEKFKESKPARPKRSTKKTVKEEDSSDDEGEDEDDDLPLSRLCSKNLENTKEEDCNERTKDGSDVECTGQDQISDSEDNIPELEDSNHEKSLNEKEEKYSISEQEMENFETDEDEVEFKPSITEMTINESESNRTELEPEPEPDPDPDPEPEPEPEIKKFDPKPPPNVKDVTRKMHDLIYEKIIRDLEENVEDEKLKEIVKVKITIMEDTKGNKTPLQQLLRLLQPIPDNRVTKSIGDKVFWHCWLCDSKFHNRHLLTRHLLIHEPEENRPYKCEICFKTFIQSNNYKEHVMSHKNENQYYCEKCGTGYRHKTHFNKHLRKHNPEMIDPRPKNFKCSYCDKRFATTFHKTEHERKHTNERPYLCKNCGRQFGTLSTLNKHMQVHAAAKHQCNICLKFFRHRYSLKRHHRTHSYNPEQRVHCECGQSFSQKPSLFRHKLICEFNEEPAPKAFECSLCSKKFGGKHDLKRHEATHETSKKFKCPICSTRCKTRETYKRHLRRHNKPNKPTTLENDFDCDECQFTSGVVKEIVRHIIQTHLNWVQNDLDD